MFRPKPFKQIIKPTILGLVFLVVFSPLTSVLAEQTAQSYKTAETAAPAPAAPEEQTAALSLNRRLILRAKSLTRLKSRPAALSAVIIIRLNQAILERLIWRQIPARPYF